MLVVGHLLNSTHRMMANATIASVKGPPGGWGEEGAHRRSTDVNDVGMERRRGAGSKRVFIRREMFRGAFRMVLRKVFKKKSRIFCGSEWWKRSLRH